jgi:hypothetical protein
MKKSNKIIIVSLILIFIIPFLFFMYGFYILPKWHKIGCEDVEIIDSPIIETTMALYNVETKESVFNTRSSFGKKAGEIYLIYQGGWDEDICKKIDYVDIDTFEVLNNDYAKDKNNVYYAGSMDKIKTVYGADPLTFKISDYNLDYEAEDKNNKYNYGYVFKKRD